MEEKYVLTLTRDQADTVQAACGLFAQLKAGQLTSITAHLLTVEDVDEYSLRCTIADDLLLSCASTIFGRNEDGELLVTRDKQYHQAENVRRMLANRMALGDCLGGRVKGLRYDDPVPSGNEPLPECRVVTGV